MTFSPTAKNYFTGYVCLNALDDKHPWMDKCISLVRGEDDFIKKLPIDLKEAISSVIFASASKIWKRITSAALELRPNCGVGRMLVEKLSANAPDGPTKLKILTAIAEEHNIKWDPESFGAKESKIYEDLLNGPKAEATKILADPPNAHASPSHYEQRPSVQVPNYDKGPPNVEDPKHIEKNNASASFYDQSLRSSPHPKNFNYSNSSADNSMSSGTCPPNSKPHGTENHRMQYRNSYPGNESALSSSRQHWNMEFKDATAAAQAAAESAEQASMAARAAAELSSRGNISQHQQYSTESHMSSAHSMREEEPRKYTGSASHNEHLAKHPVNISRYEKNSRNYEQTDSSEQHNRPGEAENVYINIVSSDKSTDSSYKSTAASFNEKPSLNDQIADAYSQRNSSEGRQMKRFAEMSMNRNSGENGMQFVNELHDIKNPQNVDHHEVRVGGQSSYSSSHSQSNTYTDDHVFVSNLNWQKSENDLRNSGESRMPFVNELHETKNSDSADYQEEGIRKQSSYSSSHSLSSTFSDDHDVVSNFNQQVRIILRGSFLLMIRKPSKKRKRNNRFSNDNASAFFEIMDQILRISLLLFSLKVQLALRVPSRWSDLPATFDDYGPGSESEEEVDKSKFVRTDPSVGSHKKNIDSHQAENSIFPPKLAEDIEDTEPSYDSSLEESKELKPSYDSSLEESKELKPSYDSSLQASKELNFGNLTGGLRNKGYRRPPYSKTPRGNALSSGEAANDISTRFKQPSPPATVEASISTGSINQEPYGRKVSEEVNRKLSTRASVTHVDSSDDDSEGERPKQTFSSTQDQYNKTPCFEENKTSSLRVPISYFGSGNIDSDEDLPKPSLKARSNAGFSQRTKASPSNSRRSSNLKTTISSQPTVVSDYGGEKDSSSRSSNADEALPKSQSRKKNSDHCESFQHAQLASQATSKLVSETKRSSFDGTLKSSEKEQPSTSVLKIEGSNLKAQTSIGEGSSKGSVSHVHPKLPDYDILTAHLNSLRQNRQ
ncbi:uncharacterized protein LOC111300860 [Durio zibethinus]|uniref:Uncharacterized protein LOC111300860 n=1 Tax=Durio zibethinus TaxID=66656 RepID=A0A6P5ZI21_DURZI|nr:uncharacterized protein LOC111300860 [Durio zibethinus]